MNLSRWLPIAGAIIGGVIGVTRSSLSQAAPLADHIVHHAGPVLAGLLIGIIVDWLNLRLRSRRSRRDSTHSG